MNNKQIAKDYVYGFPCDQNLPSGAHQALTNQLEELLNEAEARGQDAILEEVCKLMRVYSSTKIPMSRKRQLSCSDKEGD